MYKVWTESECSIQLIFLFRRRTAAFAEAEILNLRQLNQFMKVLRFHMLRTADVLKVVSEGDWFTSVDLKDAYFHVPVAPHHRQFLRFAFKTGIPDPRTPLRTITCPSDLY